MTKKLKKHSSRLVGGVETGSWGGEDVARWWLADQEERWKTPWEVPHLRSDKPGGTTGE